MVRSGIINDNVSGIHYQDDILSLNLSFYSLYKCRDVTKGQGLPIYRTCYNRRFKRTEHCCSSGRLFGMKQNDVYDVSRISR